MSASRVLLKKPSAEPVHISYASELCARKVDRDALLQRFKWRACESVVDVRILILKSVDPPSPQLVERILRHFTRRVIPRVQAQFHHAPPLNA
eukprot:4810047-Prymnesium_polylepis.1